MIQDKHKTKAQLIDEFENLRQHFSTLELEVARRKQAEEELKKNERNLAKAQEIGRIGSWEWDIETDKGSWSHETYRMFGFEPGEIVVTFETLLTRIHPDDRERVAREIEVGVNEHKAIDMEYRVFRKDGNEVLVHSRAEVTVDKTGKPIDMVGVIQDITERKGSEEALAESERRYRAVFEQAADAIVVVDAETGEFVDFNDSACQNLGYTRQEFEELTISDFEVIESREEVEEHVRRVVERGSDVFETRQRRKNGEVRDIHVSARAISIGGRGFLMAIWHDVTERKRSEEALQRSREELRDLAERLNTIREEERTVIARELQDELGQVLAALRWDVHAMANGLPEHLVGEREQALAMLDQIDAAAGSVRELSSRLRPPLLDDLGLVAAIEWQAQQFSSHTRIPCELDLSEGKLTLETDRATAVFRVLQEALTNVTRHAEAKHVSISLEATDEGISMVVRDDGKGITDAELVGSQSLGLVGMRERALALGGEVKVCRVVDGGTAVTLRLPVAG